MYIILDIMLPRNKKSFNENLCFVSDRFGSDVGKKQKNKLSSFIFSDFTFRTYKLSIFIFDSLQTIKKIFG